MASLRETRPTVLPNEQKHMGAPVVHAPGLPSMEKVDEVKTLLRNTALPLMAADAAAEVRGEQLMERVGSMSQVPPTHSLGPQRAKEGMDRRDRLARHSRPHARIASINPPTPRMRSFML